MSVMSWSAIVGTFAALSTTLAFWPQLLTVKRQGGAGLSWSMLAMYLAGQLLWLGYGVMNDARAVIAANLASIALVSAIVVLKVRADRPRIRRRLRIAIDMDEVMADALAEHVRRYNLVFGAQLTIAELRGGSVEDHVPPAHREAAEALLDASFFRDLAVMADCQAVIRDLADRHDVFIATAAMDVPVSFDAKYQWLREHFPFIPPSRFVFCGDKSVIDADYLIDDRARHFANFKGRPLLFSAPHNAGETRYPRVASWAEIGALFATLEGGLDARPGTARSSRWLQPRERSL